MTSHPTKSSVALAEALGSSPEFAKAARAAFHRTMVWNWATARRCPSHRSAHRLAKLAARHGFRIPADGWVDDAQEAA